MVGELGQGLGRADPDADRDAELAVHRGAQGGGVAGVIGDLRDIEETFIDRIGFHPARKRLANHAEAAVHVAIEFHLARAHPHRAPLRRGQLEHGHPHADAEGLGLRAAGDGAAVIAGEDDDRLVPERGIEHPLAAHIEILGIDEGEHPLRPDSGGPVRRRPQ